MNFSNERESYRLAVLRHIIRPLYSLSTKAKIEAEMQEDSHYWADNLFGVIPSSYLAYSFRRASQNQSKGFAPNYFQLINEYKNIAREESERREKEQAKRIAENPVDHCKDKAQHVNPLGEIKFPNPFNQTEDLILPCFTCRKKAHDERFADFIRSQKSDENSRGKSLILPSPPAVEKIVRDATPKLSVVLPDVVGEPEEMQKIADQYNELVDALVLNETNRRQMYVKYDEGGLTFKRIISYQTFSLETMQDLIKTYQHVLRETEEIKNDERPDERKL
jgi:hypothetical protein